MKEQKTAEEILQKHYDLDKITAKSTCLYASPSALRAMEEYASHKWVTKEGIIDALEKRREEAFQDGFHNNENKRLAEAITTIKQLLPPTTESNIKGI